MAISKNERINRLNKKRIWPSILGMVFIVALSAVLIYVMVELLFVQLFENKIADAVDESKKIAGLFESYHTGEAAQTTSKEQAEAYLDILTDAKDVYLTTEQGVFVWSLNGNVPVSDNVLKRWSETDGDLQILPYNLIVQDDPYQIFTLNRKGSFEDIRAKFKTIMGLVRKLNNSSADTQQTGALVWCQFAVEGYKVYVLNHIPVLTKDVASIVGMIGFFALFLFIFVVYYVCTFIGIIASTRKTTRIIYTDMVTGGRNWLYFVKNGQTKLKRRRGKKKVALVHLHMRKYRSFCTCFGVQKGEQLLERFYSVLQSKMRRKEQVALQENAKFGLLLIYKDKQSLKQRLSELEAALKQSIPGVRIRFGFGVCEVPAKDNDVEKHYNNAVTACELLDEDAENHIAFFDEEMNRQRIWERKVEDEMESALANKEFAVYLQPKVSTAAERLAGAEALVRWLHPIDGLIAPYKFIPLFEKNGFIVKLDDYMLEAIARQQAEWLAQNRPAVPISVNISRANFAREDLAEHICSIVDRYQVPHNVIELELTESAFFDDKKALVTTVNKLREKGFPVSMDDFGAGYSSLNSLKELTIDTLKIDAGFFRDVQEVERGMLIVSEVIDLAKKLNMQIVAEGIESREQVDFLMEQECDLIQGYYYAKPMPIVEFESRYHW